MKLSSRTSTQVSRAGFTLIELLVVIAIIAILAGLLMPVVSAVMEHARKVQALNDETQIVMAVKSYYTDYGKYPIDPSKIGTDVVYSGDNNTLLDVLRNRTGSNIGNILNPRAQIFFEPKAASNQSAPRGGLQSSTGVLYDPWGTPYNIAIDGDNDGMLNTATSPLPNFYSDVTSFQAGVAVWANGKNGELGGGAANKSGFSSESGSPGKRAGSGDVVSW